MSRYVAKWFPVARIYHPYPNERFGVRTLGRSPVR
jgi:RNA-directed DNA polymerase